MSLTKLWLLAGIALLCTACATIPKAGTLPEPELLLPREAPVYVRMEAASLDLVLPSLLSVADTGTAAGTANYTGLRQFTERTERLVAALVPGSAAGQLSWQAVARGNYPAHLINLGLGADPAWKRQGKDWIMRDAPLYLHAAAADTILLASGPLDSMRQIATDQAFVTASPAASDPNHPVPASLRSLWESDLALVLNDPITLVGERLELPQLEIPLRLVLFGANRTANAEEELYEMRMAYRFDNARAALIFSPLCRLFFYGLAHQFWPLRASTLLDEANWRVEDTTVSAAGIVLTRDELVQLLALIR